MFLYMLRFIFTFLPSHLMRQNCELLSVCREQASQQATKPPLGRPTTTSIRVSIRDSNHGQSFRMHAHHHELSSQYLLAHGRLVNEGIGLDFSPSSRFWFRSTLPVSTFQVWRWHSIWFGKFHHPRRAWAPLHSIIPLVVFAVVFFFCCWCCCEEGCYPMRIWEYEYQKKTDWRRTLYEGKKG